MMIFIMLILLPIIGTLALPTPKKLEPPTTISDQAPIIGYDCNKTDPEVLAMSALEVGPCPSLDQLTPKVTLLRGQIIQKHEYKDIRVRTCQFTKSTFYFKCGRSWSNYQVYPPSIGTIVHLTPTECTNIHEKGIFEWSPNFSPWTGLEVNKTFQRSVNEVGWTDKYGYCEGGTYQIAGQTHSDIVVQTSMSLSIRESWSVVDQENGKINLENTVTCQYTAGSCFDAVSGTHVWTPSTSSCPEETYIELYKGPVNITQDPQNGLALLSINNPPFLFSAELGTKTFVCSLSLQLTEFPGVYFLETKDGMYQASLPRPKTSNIQFITYLNAKITFAYHNLMQSSYNLYYQAMMRSCEIERDVLKNRIEIIRLTSSSGALSTLLQGGMFARANGEVIHVLKCEPIPVQLRNTDTCYDALPIISNGKPQFLLPNTHIIAMNASQIPCTPITPLTYKIGGRWWAFTGSFQPVQAPQIIHPRGIEKMQFTVIRSFSRGGMYSSDQIEAVQKMFSFPNLREAITTNLAAGVTHYFGKPIPMDISNIMSETDIESIAERNMKKVWGVFSSIGNAVSGLIGIYFVFRLIKGVINTMIDAKELYGAFGLSLRLMAALWSRLALYFINQARTQDRGQQPSPPSSHEASTTSADPQGPEAPQPPSAPLLPIRYRSVFSGGMYPEAAAGTMDTKV